MNINELSEEVKAKLRECKSAEELRALAEEEGIELTDELLEAVSGGWDFPIRPFKCESLVIPW